MIDECACAARERGEVDAFLALCFKKGAVSINLLTRNTALAFFCFTQWGRRRNSKKKKKNNGRPSPQRPGRRRLGALGLSDRVRDVPGPQPLRAHAKGTARVLEERKKEWKRRRRRRRASGGGGDVDSSFVFAPPSSCLLLHHRALCCSCLPGTSAATLPLSG